MLWMALAVSLLTFAKCWLSDAGLHVVSFLHERGVVNVTSSNGKGREVLAFRLDGLSPPVHLTVKMKTTK